MPTPETVGLIERARVLEATVEKFRQDLTTKVIVTPPPRPAESRVVRAMEALGRRTTRFQISYAPLGIGIALIAIATAIAWNPWVLTALVLLPVAFVFLFASKMIAASVSKQEIQVNWHYVPTAPAHTEKAVVTCVIGTRRGRADLSSILRSHLIDVAAATDDGQDALTAIEEFRPHVALIDVMLPRVSGIEIARAARNHELPTRVVLRASEADIWLLQNQQLLDQTSVLFEDARPREIVRALWITTLGSRYTDSAIGLLRDAMTGAKATDLSKLDHEILVLLAEGLSSQEIAARLQVPSGAVGEHVREILAKLQLEHKSTHGASTRLWNDDSWRDWAS
jgi:DNA-binding NarL/FixJ family response regulator